MADASSHSGHPKSTQLISLPAMHPGQTQCWQGTGWTGLCADPLNPPPNICTPLMNDGGRVEAAGRPPSTQPVSPPASSWAQEDITLALITLPLG